METVSGDAGAKVLALYSTIIGLCREAERLRDIEATATSVWKDYVASGEVSSDVVNAMGAALRAVPLDGDLKQGSTVRIKTEQEAKAEEEARCKIEAMPPDFRQWMRDAPDAT